MAEQPHQVPIPKTSELFTGAPVRLETSHPFSAQFWVGLMLYRPFIILSIAWGIMMGIAGFAYVGLLSSGAPAPGSTTKSPPTQMSPKETQTPAATPTSPQANPTEIPPALVNSQSSTILNAPTDPIITTSEQPESDQVPIWSLGTLVLACAVGCWVIGRRATAPPRTPKPLITAVKRMPPPPSSPVPTPPAETPSLRRLKPYKPDSATSLLSKATIPSPSDRVGVQAAQRTVNQPSVPLPAPLRPPGSPPPPQLQPNEGGLPSAPPNVNVVPPHQSHPLDWPDGSLAHQLDVRQHRSLSSFL